MSIDTTSKQPQADTTKSVSADLYIQVSQFLGLEARLLDEGREEEWLGLLAEDLSYEVPIRAATAPRSDEFSVPGYRIRDTKLHMETRVARLNTGIAYSEVPPSRTLRLVGSIQVLHTDDREILEVHSGILLYRQRGIDSYYDLLPARRIDHLRITDSGLRIVRRRVLHTETSLETPNLAVIL